MRTPPNRESLAINSNSQVPPLISFPAHRPRRRVRRPRGLRARGSDLWRPRIVRADRLAVGGVSGSGTDAAAGGQGVVLQGGRESLRRLFCSGWFKNFYPGYLF